MKSENVNVYTGGYDAITGIIFFMYYANNID